MSGNLASGNLASGNLASGDTGAAVTAAETARAMPAAAAHAREEWRVKTSATAKDSNRPGWFTRCRELSALLMTTARPAGDSAVRGDG